jgi:phosphoribosylcarboxyaminoimidazole (NCAIR) mutase
MLSLNDADLAQRLQTFRKKQAETVKATTLPTL